MAVMKRGLITAVVAMVAVCMLAPAAWAGILDDAADGSVDGTYTAADARAALKLVRSDPIYSQYSDIEAVLAAYIAGLSSGGGAAVSGGQASVESDSDESSGNAAGGSGSGTSPAGIGVNASAASAAETASATHAPLPAASAWDQAQVRFAAVPWFFAVIAAALVAGAILLRRRRAA